MRGKMIVVALSFAAVTLIPGIGSAQAGPERREEWRDRCSQIREELEHARHEERRDMNEGERHEARESQERVEHMRQEFREHNCEDVLRR